MNTEKKQLDKHTLQLTVRVTRQEARPYLTKAAGEISKTKTIPGFRPGKAPYELIKRDFGEAAIISEALDDMVNGTINEILDKEPVRYYGRIKFDLLPVANADEIVAYSATFTLMPNVKLGNWQKNKIKRNEVKVGDKDLEAALDELAGMTTKEEEADRLAAHGDKVIVDFEVIMDGKVIDGGKANDFAVTIGEGRMIPGFEEKIIGAKKNDKLDFQLKFPGQYQAAHLAGKPADFKIAVKQVLARIKPEINDEFAKRLGVADVAELKKRISENLKKEKERDEEERVEIAAMKQIVDTTDISEIPHDMLHDTVHELIHEFEHNLVHQGMKMDDYLKSIGKDMNQLEKDYEPKALNRVKSSMALGQLAEDEKLSITPEEVAEELEAQSKTAQGNPERLNELKQPEFQRHVANQLINRKLIQFIKSKIIE